MTPIKSGWAGGMTLAQANMLAQIFAKPYEKSSGELGWQIPIWVLSLREKIRKFNPGE